MKKQILALAMAVFAGFGLAPKADAAELNISGFVDVSYYSANNPDSNTFGADAVELDITSKTDDGKAGFRVDLDVPVEPTVNNGDTLSLYEQAYIELYFGSATLTAGKFNAPIGWELLDAPDMYQYSHAMVFDYGLPTNLTGLMLSGGAGVIDVAVYYVNGWDQNSDADKDKSIGGRLGITPSDAINLGISFISGNETASGATKATSKSVTDVDFTFTGVENLTVGAEYNTGKWTDAGGAGSDSKWNGYLVMANYGFTDKVAVTLRYDAFNDKEGLVFGNGGEEKRNAITFSPSYAISDGLGVLFEYKTTNSDLAVYNGQKSQTEMAVEMTYSF